jgi:holliday junction DNA helicase RuvA
MIGYVRGKVLECAEGKALLAVSASETGAVGYQLSVPQSAAYDSMLPGTVAELYVHTHVREDALDLYGFASRAEKELFLTLISVNGIGPKVALGMLSGAGPDQLVQAILEADKAFLTRLPGVGKKTAERVVLELGDTLRKKIDSGSMGRPNSSPNLPLPASTPVRDATAALVGLGYREHEVSPLLAQLLADSAGAPPRTEELVRGALRRLAL